MAHDRVRKPVLPLRRSRVDDLNVAGTVRSGGCTASRLTTIGRRSVIAVTVLLLLGVLTPAQGSDVVGRSADGVFTFEGAASDTAAG